ncbi:hypothetical protein U1Q18_008197 [Sarracenia purpurea var. burkii]
MASTMENFAEKSGRANPDAIHIEEVFEEEEEELFEIDLEVVTGIPQPETKSYFTAATSNALLANCLLPIAHLSSAIPMTSNPKARHPFPLAGGAASHRQSHPLSRVVLVVVDAFKVRSFFN